MTRVAVPALDRASAHPFSPEGWASGAARLIWAVDETDRPAGASAFLLHERDAGAALACLALRGSLTWGSRAAWSAYWLDAYLAAGD